MKDKPEDLNFLAGYVCVIIAAALWASSGSLSKYLFSSGLITPFDLVQARITLACFFMFFIMLASDRSKLKISKKSAGYFIVLGVGGMAAVQITYLFAISRINVAAAILIQYLAPAFIAVYYIVSGREKTSGTTIIAVMMSVFGCFFVAGGSSLDFLSMDRAGLISALASAVAFAFYSVAGEHGMKKHDPSTVLFYAIFFAALAWNIFRMPFSWVSSGLDLKLSASLFYIAFLGTVVPFMLYFWAIKIIRPTRACITATLEPIIAGIISWIFLGETMDIIQVCGGLLVIVSVAVLQLKHHGA